MRRQRANSTHDADFCRAELTLKGRLVFRQEVVRFVNFVKVDRKRAVGRSGRTAKGSIFARSTVSHLTAQGLAECARTSFCWRAPASSVGGHRWIFAGALV